jgi:hypothetical protein
MKKMVLLILAITLLLSACSGGAQTPTEASVIPEAVETMTDAPAAVPQDILGVWVLDREQSTFAGSSMLDPLEGEIFEAIKVEITSDYFILGDFGHTYSWIDAKRIRIDGVMVGFGSVTDGFFYVFTVQREGDVLRLVLAEGTPYAVFGRAGSAATAPAIDVAVTEDEAPAAQPLTQPIAPTPWTSCEGSYETHLFKGGYAFVNPVPPDPNIVRSTPDSSSAQTGLLQPNELMEVVDGPQCSGGWVWWHVRSKKTGLSGWTAEGDGASDWLLPCPLNGSECGAP